MQTDHFQGKDGYVWWHGVVEDRKDPMFLGRCRVRILGWHTADKAELPTASLPWAYPVMPITSASQTGVGEAPVGPVDGTWVMGYYRDGELAQEPVMIGTLPGIPENYAKQNTGFNDSRLDEPSVDRHVVETDGQATPGGSDISLTGWPYPPKDTLASAGKEVTITEYTDEERQTFFVGKTLYPRKLNEPTTSRYARGKADATTHVETSGIFARKNMNAGSAKIRTSYTLSSSLVKVLTRTNSDGDIDVLSEPLADDPDRFTVDLSEDIQQPMSPYAAVYPFNHVYESESGHLVEIDDTPSKERLHWFHRSGTFTEFHPKGNRTDRTMGHHYDVTTGNAETIISGREKKVVGLESFTRYGKDKIQTVTNDYVLTSANGDVTVDAPAGAVILSGGSIFIDAGTTLVLNASQIIRSDDSPKDIMKGNAARQVQGGDELSCGSQNTNIMGACDKMVGGNENKIISEMKETIIANQSCLITGNVNAEKTSATFGKLVKECKDGALTGGIDSNMGIGGAMSQIAQSAGGDINIASTTGPSGISLSATKGVTIEGLVEAAVKSAMVDIIADAELNMEGGQIYVNGKSEPIIKGEKFKDVFMKHTHPSSVGPTGPTTGTFASKVAAAMSKKAYVG